MHFRTALFSTRRSALSIALAAFALALGWASSANATLMEYDFNYTMSGGSHVLTGMLDGTLQPDNNTVVISAITSAEFDGTSLLPLTYLNSVEGFLGTPGFPPVASLDGLVLDFISCTDASCGGPVAFLFFTNQSPPVFLIGGGGEDYDPARWSMVAVPEPGTIGLFVTGLFGLALMRRRSGWDRALRPTT
jgi:hypothetical protein